MKFDFNLMQQLDLTKASPR